MNRSAWTRATGLALGALAAAALAACGSSGMPQSAARAPAHTAKTGPHHPVKRQAIPGAVPSSDLVAAVGSDEASVPVDVRFALRGRPEVGKPVELEVEVTPSGPIGKLVTSFHADDGLAIQSGGAASETVRPEPGVALSRALTIVAKRDGIFYVSATVLVDNGADSVARTYTIPVIAGAGAS